MSESPLLHISDLNVKYGNAQALFGVDLSLGSGECLTVVGANGAGKSTLASAIAGLTVVTSGRILFAGRDVTGLTPQARARQGLGLLPETRAIFPGLSVEDNLRMGCMKFVPRGDLQNEIARAYERFPQLGIRRRQIARTLSGGEQQMLALARVLVVRPRVLVADEPSLGLAPLIIDHLYDDWLSSARDSGISILLIEQSVDRALRFADRVIVLKHGHIVWSGATAGASTSVMQAYV